MNKLPANWSNPCLSEATIFIKDGTHGSHKDTPNGIPLLSAKDVFDGKVEIKPDSRLISKEDYRKIHKKYEIESGDILLTIVGTIGRTALVPKMNKFSVQRSVAIIRSKESILNKFLYYFIQSNIFQNQLFKSINAGAQGGVYLGELNKIKISLPSLPEQKKIETILSSVDDAITKTKNVIEKTKKLKKGIMQKLLTRGIGHAKFKKTKIGEIPKKWSCMKMKDCCDEIFLGLTSKVDYVESGGIPLVRASDISSGKLSFKTTKMISQKQHQSLTKYRKAQLNDILITKSGNLGTCVIVDTEKEFSIYESIIVIRGKSNLILQEFILWILQDENSQARMLKNKVGGAIHHLNLNDFKNLLVAIPDSLEEQEIISSKLNSLEIRLKKDQSYCTQLIYLKQSLMQQLLTGKVRVG